jgi:DNA end-binding protein Ku
VRGYEYEKGKWVEITDEDLDALDLESLRSIDIEMFSPLDQIDPMYFDKTYYLVPEGAAVKAYRLIADALEDEGLVGVAKVALREREHLAAIRVKDGALVLETMHWPEEIRDMKFEELKKRPRVQDRERKMARQLIQQLTDDFDPSRFKDEYHKELKKLIRKKVKGEEIVIPERAEEPSGVVDLMEALKASVEAARRGERPKPPAASKKKSSGGKKGADEDLTGLTKQELDELAKKRGISGRSKMDKKALMKALTKSA